MTAIEYGLAELAEDVNGQVLELVDRQVSKTCGRRLPCGFDSLLAHQ